MKKRSLGGAHVRRLTPIVVMATAVASLGAAASGFHDADSTTYVAPYPEGSEGGDDYNLIHRGDDGRMAVGRAYPVPSFLSCDARGGYSNYRITHPATGPADNVEVHYSEAAIDPYTFIVMNVTAADGSIIGTLSQHGPITDAGDFAVPLTWSDDTTFPQDISIEFGLSLTSACPSADLGTVLFDSVTINPNAH